MAKAKRIDNVDCGGPLRTGLMLVLNTRLEEMCAFRSAALDWSDPEGVHNMRVASRRLRGALRDFLPYLDRRSLSTCLKKIKDIADALGNVRDHDVAIMTLERIEKKAPAGVAEGILRLAELRKIDREEQRIRLLPALDPEALAKLKVKFTRALEAQAKPPRRKAVDAFGLTYQGAAASIILGRLEELEGLSDSLYHPLKTKALHDMRIAAKHVRYALEVFAPCWGPGLGEFAKKVTGLQSSLGRLHDCDVWIADLGDAAANLQSDQEATVIWLLNYFVKERGKHLSKALEQWRKWHADDLGAKLRKRISWNASQISVHQD